MNWNKKLSNDRNCPTAIFQYFRIQTEANSEPDMQKVAELRTEPKRTRNFWLFLSYTTKDAGQVILNSANLYIFHLAENLWTSLHERIWLILQYSLSANTLIFWRQKFDEFRNKYFEPLYFYPFNNFSHQILYKIRARFCNIDNEMLRCHNFCMLWTLYEVYQVYTLRSHGYGLWAIKR